MRKAYKSPSKKKAEMVNALCLTFIAVVGVALLALAAIGGGLA